MTLQNTDSLDPAKIKENDRLIRTKISDYLNLFRKDLKTFEYNYRQEFLPPPTREKPFPDKKAINFLASVKKIELRIENLETSIRGADSSLDDKVWNKHKNKNEVLAYLCKLDEEMMNLVTYFYHKLAQETLQESNVVTLDPFLTSVEQKLKERQEYLRIQVKNAEFNF